MERPNLCLLRNSSPCFLWIEGWPCQLGELQPTRLTSAVSLGSWCGLLSVVLIGPLSVARRAAEAGRYRAGQSPAPLAG